MLEVVYIINSIYYANISLILFVTALCIITNATQWPFKGVVCGQIMFNRLTLWLYCMQLLTLDAKHVKNRKKKPFVNPTLYFHVISLLQSIYVCIYLFLF